MLLNVEAVPSVWIAECVRISLKIVQRIIDLQACGPTLAEDQVSVKLRKHLLTFFGFCALLALLVSSLRDSSSSISTLLTMSASRVQT